ncbi:MAG TPA: hypothetical protein VFM21_05430 [Terriglobia bacterium]|nr:hypothetical protein [Terriglobia bacterium]
MTGTLLYALIAILLIVASLWLYRRGTRIPAETLPEDRITRIDPLDGSSLRLAERIFDARDFKWLREELCFPQAAEILKRHRKTLAIQWLNALRTSFKELVRLPETPAPARASRGASSWELLWLTLRFQFLINYALLVVSLFGPYHRMVPVLGTMKSLRILGFSKSGIDQVSEGRIP